MITRNRLDLGRLARFLGLPLLLLVAFDLAVTLVYKAGLTRVAVDGLPLPLLGSAIALIVTFRNNAAYDRWWEARGLWGLVVNNSRSLARGLQTFIDDTAIQDRLIRCQIAHALALRCALLVRPPWDDIAPYVPADLLPRLRTATNVPNAIHSAVAQELGALRRAGTLDPIGARALDATLTALANAQGGLERIKRTPMPRQYNQFPQVFVLLYCVLLPIGLLTDLGSFTVLGAATIGFMFLSLDRIGRDLEDPFEGKLHDVPMRAITRTIEIDLLQTIGVETTLEPIKPVDGVLW
ncbi:MAG: bestrophin family protein [Janthinobacterium lividum]